MTVSAVSSPYDVMCSETNNVTVTSIKVRSASTSSPDHAQIFSPPTLRRSSYDDTEDTSSAGEPDIFGSGPDSTRCRTEFNGGDIDVVKSEVEVTRMETEAGTLHSDVMTTSKEPIEMSRDVDKDIEDGLRVTSVVSETVPIDSPSPTSVCSQEEDEVTSGVNGVDKLWKSPAVTNNQSLHDCAKLVYQLSRELAVLDGLTLAVGGDTDSNKLREELRASRHRVCSLAQQNGGCLIPLLRSKTGLKEDESSAVERLHRIYSGCLEYLVYLLNKVRSLLDLFCLDNEHCHLIQTGITDPLGIVHKTCFQRDGPPAPTIGCGSTVTLHNQGVQSSQAQTDLLRLTKDIKAIQQLLCAVNNASDVQPWDVVDDTNQGCKAGSTKKRIETRSVTFQDQGLNRRQQRLVVSGVMLGTVIIIVIAVIIAVALLSKS